MWLLDANMDVHLASVLTGLGIECDTAGNRGWKALSNGDLVKAAVDAGFRCLLTRDRLFGESASRARKRAAPWPARRAHRPYRSRRLLLTTVTLERAMAADATIGESRPKAAIGIPSVL